METVILNGEEMNSVDVAHQYLAAKLHFPCYYGRNLDALWDVLSTKNEPVSIKLINADKIQHYLGGYAKLLLEVMHEAADANEKVYFEIVQN